MSMHTLTLTKELPLSGAGFSYHCVLKFPQVIPACNQGEEPLLCQSRYGRLYVLVHQHSHTSSCSPAFKGITLAFNAQLTGSTCHPVLLQESQTLSRVVSISGKYFHGRHLSLPALLQTSELLTTARLHVST